MATIKLSTNYNEPLARQTPRSSGRWGECDFIINRPVDCCDAWIVHEGVSRAESAFCPPQNTVLITGEPPSIKSYFPGFLDQFGLIVTCHSDLKHPRVLFSQQALPWHLGVVRTRTGLGNWQPVPVTYDYDALGMMAGFSKEKLISVVCSNKRQSRDHRQRLVFVERLERHFGSRLSRFGRGFTPVRDKAEAILPYRYHITLENCSRRDYWTEKLADAYLGGAYPIYYGCPNLADYFPSEAFTRIDINDPDGAIARIEEVIDNDYYVKHQDALSRARALVLEQYNLFAVAHDLWRRMASDSPESVTIQPESFFRRRNLLVRRALDWARR